MYHHEPPRHNVCSRTRLDKINPIRERGDIEREIGIDIAVRLHQDNVMPFQMERRLISIRPVECTGSRVYRSRHSHRAMRNEPSASIRKRIFDVAVAGAALLFLAPLLIVIAVVIKITSPGRT